MDFCALLLQIPLKSKRLIGPLCGFSPFEEIG